MVFYDSTSPSPCRVLICDPVGLRLDASGKQDFGEVRTYVESLGASFRAIGAADQRDDGELPRIRFHYLPHLGTEREFLEEVATNRYHGVIAAATVVPEDAAFPLGGVRIGAGTDNMRSRSWGGPRGIGGQAPLMNTPGINSRTTAHMVMKAVLRVVPDLPLSRLHDLVMRDSFDTARDLRRYPTEKLEGRRFAVLGYGHIGREVARLAAGFGMEVRVYARDRHRPWIESEGFEYAASPAAATRGADVLSVHTGLGPYDSATGRYANSGLVAEDVLSGLRPGAVLVNFDRGELVDVPALEKALETGAVAHAAIDADVFLDERGKAFGPLVGYRSTAERFPGRLLLLPHVAADTDHPTRVAGAKQAIDQIMALILYRQVANLVGDLPAGCTMGSIASPAGIGAVHPGTIASIPDDGGLRDLALTAREVSEFLAALRGHREGDRRAAFAQAHGARFLMAANRLRFQLHRLGLQGMYEGETGRAGDSMLETPPAG